MRLHIVSDLHIEFAKYTPHSASNEADVIILPGDIWLSDMGINWARGEWPDKRIIYVAGNHEFYRTHRPSMIAELRKAAAECDVHFLDNDEVIIDGVRFLGATLWTDFKLFGVREKAKIMKRAETGLNDFRLITEHTDPFKRFTPQNSIDLFNESVAYLETALNTSFDGKTIVVTHHLPSKRSVSPKYLVEPLSACFASKLDRLLGKSALWLHGHTHDSFDYVHKGTRVICNPRGYSRYNRDVENANFNPSLIVEI